MISFYKNYIKILNKNIHTQKVFILLIVQLFLKFFSFAIMLPMHDNNMNREVASLYRSHMSTTHHDAISKRATEQSSDDSRIDFQIRNHQGLGTYIFGFDTGSG